MYDKSQIRTQTSSETMRKLNLKISNMKIQTFTGNGRKQLSKTNSTSMAKKRGIVTKAGSSYKTMLSNDSGLRMSNANSQFANQIEEPKFGKQDSLDKTRCNEVSRLSEVPGVTHLEGIPSNQADATTENYDYLNPRNSGKTDELFFNDKKSESSNGK